MTKYKAKVILAHAFGVPQTWSRRPKDIARFLRKKPDAVSKMFKRYGVKVSVIRKALKEADFTRDIAARLLGLFPSNGAGIATDDKDQITTLLLLLEGLAKKDAFVDDTIKELAPRQPPLELVHDVVSRMLPPVDELEYKDPETRTSNTTLINTKRC